MKILRQSTTLGLWNVQKTYVPTERVICVRIPGIMKIPKCFHNKIKENFPLLFNYIIITYM